MDGGYEVVCCVNCLWEHYNSMKDRDAKRWTDYYESHIPSIYKGLEEIRTTTGRGLLDIFSDDAKL